MWFILALVFFVLWLIARSSLVEKTKQNFDIGYREGRKDLAEELHKALAKDPSGHTAVKRIVNAELKSYTKQTSLENAQTVYETQIEEAPSVAVEREVDTIAGYDNSQAQNVAEAASTPLEYVEKPAVSMRTKQQDVERNLNILLYTASFLIIAAAAAFIATSLPPLPRLTGLWLVIIAFYVAGLILHAKVSYLRPAATAFIGTGIALVPFAGIALSQLGGLPGGWAWFITSAIGIISYLVAALRLKSEVVTYLTVGFSLSLAASTVAAFNAPFVMYFVVLIIASLLFHLLAHYNPKWVPEVFKLPISQTSQLLTPVVLVGSLFVYQSMTLVSYQAVFWVATLYYLVLWFTERGIVYETVVRVLASLSMFISVLYVFNYDVTALLIYIVAAVAIQSTYSLLRVNISEEESRNTEAIWLALAVVALVVAAPFWLTTNFSQLGFILNSCGVIAISIAWTYRFRSVLFAIPALLVSVVLPFTIGRWPGDEIFTLQALTWIFIAASVAMLALSIVARKRSEAVQGFMQAGFWLYVITAFLVSFGQGSAVAYIVSSTALAVVFLAASYVYRAWFIEVISLILVVPIVSLTMVEIGTPAEWISILSVGFSAATYCLVLLAHHMLGQSVRRDVATVGAVIIGGGLLLSLGQAEYIERIAFSVGVFYVALGLSLRQITASKTLQALFTITYATYPLLVLLFAFSLGHGWIALALGISVVTTWWASYIHRSWLLEVLGFILAIPAIAITLSEAGVLTEWMSILTVGLSALLYGTVLLVHNLRKETVRRDAAMVAAIVVGGGLVLSVGQPAVVQQVAFFAALLYSVIGFELRRVTTSKMLRSLFTMTYLVYPLVMVLFALQLSTGWLVLALAVVAAAYWVASYVEKEASIIAFGNLAFIAMVAAAWSWLDLSDEWFMFGVAWVSAAVFYIVTLIHAYNKNDAQRRLIHLVFAWVLLGAVTMANLLSDGSYGYAAASTLLVIAGTIAIEGAIMKRREVIEVSIYVGTFALQRIVGLSAPDLNIAFYGHWWAIVIFAVALWIRGASLKTRLITAVSLITVSTGVMALLEGGTYQLLFLFEHVVLLVTGALLRAPWALWWGLVATVLAVLYFLRESLFLALLFLGLTLLAIVIWRLIRNNRKK